MKKSRFTHSQTIDAIKRALQCPFCAGSWKSALRCSARGYPRTWTARGLLKLNAASGGSGIRAYSNWTHCAGTGRNPLVRQRHLHQSDAALEPKCERL